MSEPVDLGNEKAAAILENQLRQQMDVSNKYVIAYCSGDGDELITEPFTGNKKDRFTFMQGRGIDPDLTNNWAFGQWSVKELKWVVAGGDGEMKQKMHQYFRSIGQRSR